MEYEAISVSETDRWLNSFNSMALVGQIVQLLIKKEQLKRLNMTIVNYTRVNPNCMYANCWFFVCFICKKKTKLQLKPFSFRVIHLVSCTFSFEKKILRLFCAHSWWRILVECVCLCACVGIANGPKYECNVICVHTRPQMHRKTELN